MNVISSGGVNGHIKETNTFIKTTGITIDLDIKTAYALCNVLGKKSVSINCDKDQRQGLINLGIAIGTIIDHPVKNIDFDS